MAALVWIGPRLVLVVGGARLCCVAPRDDPPAAACPWGAGFAADMYATTGAATGWHGHCPLSLCSVVRGDVPRLWVWTRVPPSSIATRSDHRVDRGRFAAVIFAVLRGLRNLGYGDLSPWKTWPDAITFAISNHF